MRPLLKWRREGLLIVAGALVGAARGNVEGNVGRSPLLPTQNGFPASGVRGPAAINFVIRWSNGSIGIYTGKISNFGWGEGTTWDMRNPQSQARWILSPTAKCRSG